MVPPKLKPLRRLPLCPLTRETSPLCTAKAPKRLPAADTQTVLQPDKLCPNRPLCSHGQAGELPQRHIYRLSIAPFRRFVNRFCGNLRRCIYSAALPAAAESSIDTACHAKILNSRYIFIKFGYYIDKMKHSCYNNFVSKSFKQLPIMICCFIPFPPTSNKEMKGVILYFLGGNIFNNEKGRIKI